ncbi:hypothetical protein H8S33_00785 [Ornithinibacillus sp. BX22]|uniref:Uncharacterized protein n=2 Tax=Ornithinibacillus TaxID=484508 RepID=A0A923RHV5_9BACI|nr:MULTISPECIES: hypothetical protein [Ornithinibacillus]MBC5635347.1 hypothetical protein [Ornithinibacillus hominis]MBS3678921.1 hypothetical protein [Ornithinibacillus massiliensis]
MKKNAYEKVMWSIVLPGFGQLLNGRYFKGTLLIMLEIMISVQTNLNEVILLSFHGKIVDAINVTNYNWMLFYPCIYCFSIWDSVKDAGGVTKRYSFLPYVFTAFFTTIGLVYSSELTIFGVILGPIWLPLVFLFPGIAVGLILRKIMINIS